MSPPQFIKIYKLIIYFSDQSYTCLLPPYNTASSKRGREGEGERQRKRSGKREKERRQLREKSSRGEGNRERSEGWDGWEVEEKEDRHTEEKEEVRSLIKTLFF